ncbi:MAG: MFS transporter [Candidatus Lustribacter sp.]
MTTTFRAPAVTIGVLGLAGLVMVSPLYGVIPALPAIAAQLHVATTTVSWIGFTFGLAYACACLFFGPLSDARGRRWILVGGLACSAAATALVALSPNVLALYVTRGVAGFFAGTFGPVALGWVAERFSGATRAHAIAVVSAGLIGSATVGQLVFASLGAQDWRLPFVLFSGLDALCAVLVALVVCEVGLDRTGRSVLAAYRGLFGLLQHPPIPATYACGFILYGGFVAFYAGLGVYLAHAGFDGERALEVRALGLIGMTLSLLTGRIVERIGPRAVVLLGLALVVIALGGTSAHVTSVASVVVLSAFYVIGFALAAVAMNDLVVRLGGAVRGSAMAFYVFVAFSGASIGLPLAAQLRGLPFADFAGGLAALTGLAGLVVAAAVRPARADTATAHTS